MSTLQTKPNGSSWHWLRQRDFGQSDERRKLTEREFWEIKVSLSWSNTVKLGCDQPLQWMTAEERRLSKTRHFFFSSSSPTVSVTVTERTAGGKREQTGREVFYYPEWRAQIRQVPHCLFELVHMVNNMGIHRSMNDMFRVIMKINGLLQSLPMPDNLQNW